MVHEYGVLLRVNSALMRHKPIPAKFEVLQRRLKVSKVTSRSQQEWRN